MIEHRRLGALAAAALVCTAASAQPTVIDFPISPAMFTEVFNDRIGNSRFFSGPNSDLVRITGFTSPTPDTDVFITTNGAGQEFLSTNGSLTTVTLDHDATLPRQMSFVGLTSGGGGARNQYTFTYDRNAAIAFGVLDAWDTTPFSITVQNSRVPSGPNSRTFTTIDYDSSIMPSFVTDLSVTGGGLTPRLDWKQPDNGTAPTNVRIQVRRIDAESADRRRITSAALVHQKILESNITQYSFGEIFSGAGTPGFPIGLELGKRYEIAVISEVRDAANNTRGRARSFFEFSPLPEGAGNVAVFLPSAGPDGKFKFDVEVKAGEAIAIDPIVAVGYNYEVGSGDPLFASVKLPSLGDDQYELWLADGNGVYSFQTVLNAGTEYFFAGTGASSFRVLGIEESLMLDPNDVTAFVTTLTFTADGRFTGTMTPITVNVVPEPQTYALMLLGLGVIAGALRRRRNRWRCSAKQRPTVDQAPRTAAPRCRNNAEAH